MQRYIKAWTIEKARRAFKRQYPNEVISSIKSVYEKKTYTVVSKKRRR